MRSSLLFTVAVGGLFLVTYAFSGCNEDDDESDTSRKCTIQVRPYPTGFAAPWQIVGPDGARTESGYRNLTDMTPGSYTVTWGAVSGYSRPSPGSQSRTISAGETYEFSGTYTVSRPDLLFATINIGSPGNQRCNVTFNMPASRIAISNSGTQQATPPVKVQFGIWDGSSTTWWPLWTINDITNNQIWYPGAYMYNPQFNYVLHCNAPAGWYRYRLIVDPDNTINESSEGNNIWNSSYTFFLSH